MRGRWRLLTRVLGWVSFCALSSAALGAAAQVTPATRPILQHVPDEPAQTRAEKMVREVYAKELASHDLYERRALAQKMIVAAMESGDDAAARFVLLKEARDVAAGAGDAIAARKAVAALGKSYAIDQTKMTLGAATSAESAASSTEDLAEVIQVCVNETERAIVSDDYRTATRLIATAESAATKAKNSMLVEKAQEKRRELAAIFLEFQVLTKAQEHLKDQPEDAEAAARVGRFLSLYKADWKAGLPLIAKGAESGLKKLAQDDLAATTDPTRRLAAGDGWWELSANQPWLVRKHLRARAAWWYGQVVGDVNGIHRSIVQKRIDEVELAALAEQNLAPGLGVELFRGMEFKQLAKRRVDDQINFDWGMDAPDAAVGKDNFGIRWAGMIRPKESGDFEILVVANTGARVWIDQKLVFENGNLARLRNGARVTVKLDEQMHPIRVEFWDSGGAARMKLLWRRPGTVKDEVIPPSVFFHEGLAEGQ